MDRRQVTLSPPSTLHLPFPPPKTSATKCTDYRGCINPTALPLQSTSPSLLLSPTAPDLLAGFTLHSTCPHLPPPPLSPQTSDYSAPSQQGTVVFSIIPSRRSWVGFSASHTKRNFQGAKFESGTLPTYPLLLSPRNESHSDSAAPYPCTV